MKYKNAKLDAPLFYVCNDPERALGLETYLENFHIICIDYKEIVSYMENAGVNIFCLEKELKEKNSMFRNSNRLLTHPLVKRYITENTPVGKKPNIMVFKIAKNIEITCKNLGYNILNTTAELNKKFEQKLSQYEVLNLAGVNFPGTVIVKLCDTFYAELMAVLGEKFVIQYNRGHTGTGTVYINNAKQFQKEQEKFPERKARIAQFIEGETYTLNACVTKYGVAFGGLSYQITGVSEFTAQQGGTVGNDWSYPRKLTSKAVAEISLITKNVGKIMQQSGYKGLFGVDLVVGQNGEVYLIEINARQPASTSMHSKLLSKDGLMPLELMHIYEFLGVDYNLNIAQYNKTAIRPIKATQIIARNNGDTDLVIVSNVSSGVYNIEVAGQGAGGGARSGWSIDNLDSDTVDQEVLFQCMAKGHRVRQGSEIARIQFLGGGVDQKTGTLKKKYLKFLQEKVCSLKK